jgi:nitric oxide reductase subunit B
MIILGTLIFAYDMVRKRFTLRSVSTPDGSPGRGTVPERVLPEDDD